MVGYVNVYCSCLVGWGECEWCVCCIGVDSVGDGCCDGLCLVVDDGV